MAQPEPRPKYVVDRRSLLRKQVEEAMAVGVVFKDSVDGLLFEPADWEGPARIKPIRITYINVPSFNERYMWVTGDLGRIDERFKLGEKLVVQD